MSELVAFLEARLAEDEAVAREVIAYAERFNDVDYLETDEMWKCDEQSHHLAVAPARVLREVTAKRTILALLVDAEAATSEAPQEAKPFCSAHADGLRLAVRALAAPFCDHPDFQEQWR